MASNTTPITKIPRHILSLSNVEKQRFLKSFDYIFSDIDGVVWHTDQHITGAADGYQALMNAGKKLTFITNNSVRPIQNYIRKFQGLNISVDIDELWHPAKSIATYLKNINFDGLIYAIATETFKNVLREAGFKLVDSPNIYVESFGELARNIFDRQPVRAVIIDVDLNLSALKLLRAQNYLRNPDCMLIAGATDLKLPIREDIDIFGPGYFLNILVETTKREAIVLGKPGRMLADLLKQRYNITHKQRALMIGDMLEQDIGFGSECGFQTLLVLSGGCKRTHLETETNAKLIPDYYADSMQDFVKFINDLNKANI